MMIFTRSGSTIAVALDSTTSWMVFMPDQTPKKRLMAKACSPMSRMSCTLVGKNTGVPQALKMWSLWCAAVELLEMWSSPATAITPPYWVVPAMLACLKHVGAAVHARALAVPDAEHAVELVGARRREAQLLRAPEGGGRQLFVHARLEHDVLRLQVLAGLPQRLVVAAERRAAVAADEAGRVHAGLLVAQALQHGQLDQRLARRS